MLVIFDCDGVLVDTESIANTELARLITAAGMPIDMPTSRTRFNGLSMTAVRERVLAEDCVDLGTEFATTWQANLPNIFAQGVEPIAHVREAIEALRAAGIPYCVASSGTIEKMHMTLGASGLLPLLENVLFSTTMVKRGKPYPDLFEHAASAMGHAARDCVVIEDSVPGVEAGRAAGMRVLAYCGDRLSNRAGMIAAGGEPFEDMRALPRLLGAG